MNWKTNLIYTKQHRRHKIILHFKFICYYFRFFVSLFFFRLVFCKNYQTQIKSQKNKTQQNLPAIIQATITNKIIKNENDEKEEYIENK